MNLSGILVVAKPEWMDAVVRQLNELAGVEVHQTDAATGRIIAILEAADIHAEIDGLKRIKTLPHVILAEMVCHYIAEDEKVYDEQLPPELQAQGGEGLCVPSYLQH